MTNFDNDVDPMAAPQDDAEFFKHYYPYAVNLCGMFGIDENHQEDVASEIMLRHLERGTRANFNPELSFEYLGELRPARFKSYFSRSVEVYSRGHRDKINRRKQREIPVGCAVTPATGSNPSPWIESVAEVMDDPADGVHEMIDEESEAHTVRAMLAKVPPRSATDRCDLVAVYNAIRAQVLSIGEIDIQQLKDAFHVATTTMYSWVRWLTVNLAVIYGVDVPPKRRRRSPGTPSGAAQ